MLSTQGKFEAYVRRLHSQLDTTTVRATFILMMGEARDAIDRQRQLIALERLDQRDNAVSLGELQVLEKVQTTLTTLLMREIGASREELEEDCGTVVSLHIGFDGATSWREHRQGKPSADRREHRLSPGRHRVRFP